jgi:predicted short-subunit dehydrogenase-like oxidoreductase (DUF2520 family)
MTQTVDVIGARGRVGKAVSERLRERGLLARDPVHASVVLLCVPDRAIPEVAATVTPGPWIAHVSGGTSLSALAPHTRRFGVHPLQTFTHDRGPEQLDGAWAAVTFESAEASEAAFALAQALGVEPFAIDDADRGLYHAGAVIASNYLVTLHRAATSLLHQAGAPPAALEPLMRRTIDNGFALTGPIDRGDWSTVERHLSVLDEASPALTPAYLALAELTARQAGQDFPPSLFTAVAP